jgi:hypothetical protein
MTRKDYEDAFIERCKKENGFRMTFETEILLRYGYSEGAAEMGRIGFVAGVTRQKADVLAALGAASVDVDRDLP